jgi:hypothetical protein
MTSSTDVRHIGGIFSRRTGRLIGNNVRKWPKIGHLSGPIETFQCIKSNWGFDVKIWKVYIHLPQIFLEIKETLSIRFVCYESWQTTVKSLRFRQSATIQKQKNLIDKVSLISKKI